MHSRMHIDRHQAMLRMHAIAAILDNLARQRIGNPGEKDSQSQTDLSVHFLLQLDFRIIVMPNELEDSPLVGHASTAMLCVSSWHARL